MAISNDCWHLYSGPECGNGDPAGASGDAARGCCDRSESGTCEGRESARPAGDLYHIKLGVTLEPKWSDWFEGFSIVPLGKNETLLAGPVCDQAALHGLLVKIRDLGLPLLALQRAAIDAADEQDQVSRQRSGGEKEEHKR